MLDTWNILKERCYIGGGRSGCAIKRKEDSDIISISKNNILTSNEDKR